MTQAESEDLFVQFSRDLEEAMREKGFSIRKLARRADVDDQTVLNILKGRPCQVQKMIAVASALDRTLTISLVPVRPNPTETDRAAQ